MTIKVGDKLPNATLFRVGTDGIESFEAEKYFAGRKVVVFGLPGAFTPTCTAQHLPGYVKRADEFAAKDVTIACLSVNDAWVMKAWTQDQGAGGKVEMLADGNVEFTRAIGLDADMSARGYGTRCRRFSMIVDDGVVRTLAIEDGPVLDVSAAEKMLAAL
ncbi:MAG: peroxiredoxin [Alphaproteobacteria bacterium]|nr:peroxiredoxin [Alphaproteobacteria bacterium]